MSAIKLTPPNGRPLTGGDLLAQCLVALGVEVLFGIHGGHLDGFLLGCEQFGLRLVDTRHETAAIQAAEGYQKVLGKVGTCFITANSGFFNGLPGLGTAWADKSAVCCITSSQPQTDIDTNGLQGAHDQIVVAKPFTKFAHRIAAVEEIPRVVAHAYQVAVTGGPGPVLIDLPVDLQFAPVTLDKIKWGSINSPTSYQPGPHMSAITAATALWRDAKRPIIIAGTGSRYLKCSELLQKIAVSTNTPVFHSFNFVGSFPVDHPLQAGFANKLANLTIEGKPRPDFVILLGARTGTFLGGRKGFVLPVEGCKYVQIDTDGAEMGKISRVDVGIVSDGEQALLALDAELKKNPFRAADEWVTVVTGLRKAESPFEKEPKMLDNGKIHPYHALRKLFSSLKPGAIICADGGESSLWAMDLAEHAKPHMTIFSLGYMGFLGNGWGYALGAAVAEPTRQVINVQGDGSAGFHIAELDTYARFRLNNVLTVVVNNSSWVMSLHAQDILYEDKIKERPASMLSAGTAFELVAQGFENASAKVTEYEDIEKTVKELTEDARPACLNLIITAGPVHPGLEALVKGNTEPGTVRVPYYG